ncbi:MAG: hypothetical protein ACOH15_00730 [Acetobacterium sp.]
MFFILFSKLGVIIPFSEDVALQLFIMCLSIAILLSLVDIIEARLDVSSIFVDALARVLTCYMVVFVLGCFFGMFPFSLISFVYITPVLIPGFIVTYAISYITSVEYSNAINKSIKRKRKQ